ncbi:hypothetical protein D1AOALGA4SA_1598, partial [Olavius algarvensis Delta 1 endosymbiont]
MRIFTFMRPLYSYQQPGWEFDSFPGHLLSPAVPELQIDRLSLSPARLVSLAAVLPDRSLDRIWSLVALLLVAIENQFPGYF